MASCKSEKIVTALSGVDRLEAIFRRLERITTYPWGIQVSACGKYTNIVQDRGSSLKGRVASIWSERREIEANAEFIASAPIDMRWMARTLKMAILALDEASDREEEILGRLEAARLALGENEAVLAGILVHDCIGLMTYVPESGWIKHET